jgi:ABC-type transport system involved in multi-copper enzyme maturation permease subunit
MTFLPIVHRELRAAARRKSTFRVRWWTALIAMGLTFFVLAFVSLASARRAGNPVFHVFTAYAFALCLLAGIFLTADALAEEKREGTLGLLFLTDLRGYDVVLGKFIGLSLNAFYGLFALLPIAAFPLLLGGVTGAEFWRMALALINALFVSLACGICVSTFMRSSQRAMGATLGLVLLLSVALPLGFELCRRSGVTSNWLVLTWMSPVAPFVFSSELNSIKEPAQFWISLGASSFLGALFLTVASTTLPRVWQDKANPIVKWFAGGRKESGGPTTRFPESADLLSNPVLWLARKSLGRQSGAWGLVAVFGCFVAIAIGMEFSAGVALSAQAVLPFGFVLKVLFALRACNFFVEGRRDGSLELLLTTPLASREIVWGHALAMWRAFAWPIIVFLALVLAPAAILLLKSLFQQEPGVNFAGVTGSFVGIVYVLRMVADLSAICWVGMAFALTSRRPSLAPALTILYVLVLPSVLCWLDLLADLCLIAFGISKCEQDLRRVLMQQYQPTSIKAG